MANVSNDTWNHTDEISIFGDGDCMGMPSEFER